MLFLRGVAAFALLCALLLSLPPSFAQQTGGVFGPEVRPGSRALEGRVAFVPGSDGMPDRVASRLHYQQAVTDSVRLRAVVQGADTPTSGFDFDFIQLEAQWQFREDDQHGWDSALRFDLQIADDRADLVSFNWTNDIPLAERWWLRGVVLGAVQFGDSRSDGLFLQTRSSLRYQVTPRFNVQVQSFNIYGSTADFPDVDDQNHALGPAIAGKIGGGWSFEASALFGVTNGASDTDLRLFLTKSF